MCCRHHVARRGWGWWLGGKGEPVIACMEEKYTCFFTHYPTRAGFNEQFWETGNSEFVVQICRDSSWFGGIEGVMVVENLKNSFVLLGD